MNDDLNTSGALATLFELARPLRTLFNRLERGDQDVLTKEERTSLQSRWELLVKLSSVLGLNYESNDNRSSQIEGLEDASIQLAINQRKEAKINRDFAKADSIRDHLKAKGIELVDKADGTTDWFRS